MKKETTITQERLMEVAHQVALRLQQDYESLLDENASKDEKLAHKLQALEIFLTVTMGANEIAKVIFKEDE